MTDPRPLLASLMGQGVPANLGGAPGGGTGGVAFNPLDPSTWLASMLPTLAVWGEYIAIFALALILIIVGAVLLNGPSIARGVRGVPS